MTQQELAKLERALRDNTVLSVYVNGEHADPAKQTRWRLDLRHSFDDIESWLRESSHAEREAFAACRELAWEQLSYLKPGIGAPGWAAFITTEGVQHAALVSAPVPTMAVWSTGPAIAPYIRVVSDAHPVIVAVADGRLVRIYRYLDRKVDVLHTVRAHVTIDTPSHMSRPATVGFHTGTRGRAGADAAQRELQKGTELMLAEAVAKLESFATDGAWIVVGGIETIAKAAFTRLSAELSQRAMVAEHLDVHSTRAQVAECARTSALRLREADDLRRVDEAIAAAEAAGAGAAGSVDTSRALDEGRVRELYFTSKVLENHAGGVESAVRQALAQGAVVQHVSGQAAERLDRLGGIAARLRYAPIREVATAGD